MEGTEVNLYWPSEREKALNELKE
ncbi:MAG: hypothetical protein RLZZ420_488, partial [Bacteroidota bacterium]